MCNNSSVGSTETIGEGVEEINTDINLDFLQRKRSGSTTSGRRELELIAGEQQQVEKGKKMSKKSAEELAYQKECASKFKRLSQNFVCTLEIPTHMLVLPNRQQTLRGLQAQVVINDVGPRLLEQGVTAQDKSGICCMFEVNIISLNVTSECS